MEWRAVAVALVALTAGCGAFGGGASQPETTLTPAPVPTTEPTPEDPRVGVAPGLEVHGVTDLEYLAHQHRRVAGETSYVWTERETPDVRSGNASEALTLSQRVTYVNDSRYHREVPHLERREYGDLVFRHSYEAYADDDVEYRTWLGPDRSERQYDRNAPRTGWGFTGHAAGAILQYLDLENETVAERDVGDRPHYELRGTRSSVPGHGPVEDYRARALVREDGFVRSLEVAFTSERRGEPTRVRYNFTYREVGSATLEEPDWVSEARSESDDADGGN